MSHSFGFGQDRSAALVVPNPQQADLPPRVGAGDGGGDRRRFVKAISSGIRPKQSLEILTGRVETTKRGGHAFAVVRNLEDGQAKQRVQAILRRCGRGPDTKVRVLSDGEDGLRGVVGWFGNQCEHRLDWFHVARRIENLGRQLLYLPSRLSSVGDWAFIPRTSTESNGSFGIMG